MANYSRHASADATQRGLSSQIFGEPTELVRNMMVGKGLFVFDDFEKFGTIANTTDTTNDVYYAYCDDGTSIAGQQDCGALNGVKGALGAAEVAGNGTDNDEAHLQLGYGQNFSISNASGSAGPVYFECRVKKANVTDTDGLAMFVGLAGGPVDADHLVDDTGALEGSEAFVGFSNLTDDGDKWDFVYKEASQTLQTIIANVATIVANTYSKLGFRYDPDEDDDHKIKVYVNGVEQGTYVNTTQIDTATFPEDSAMAPMWLTKVGSAAETKAQLDWMAAYIGWDE